MAQEITFVPESGTSEVERNGRIVTIRNPIRISSGFFYVGLRIGRGKRSSRVRLSPKETRRLAYTLLMAADETAEETTQLEKSRQGK